MRQQQGRYYEVVYRDYHQQHPWGTTPEDEWASSIHNYPECLQRPNGYTQIPINTLCHVTHNKEAALIRSSIETECCYTFKPAAKLGKQYRDDHLPLGETYRHIERRIFRNIPRSQHDPVFPGYYCWWGVSTTKWYRECGESQPLVTQQLQRPEIKVAEFAAYHSKSRYGNNAFTIQLSKLLLSYKHSRTDIQERRHNIYLRVGGTLRYKYEICYVIIVCLQQDHNLNDLATIDTRTQDIVIHNGLVDKGKVVDYWQTPEFKAKYIISSVQDGRQYHNFSWEQVVFALYYPNEDFRLRCNVDTIREEDIEHPFCISTQSAPGGRRCPNLIP